MDTQMAFTFTKEEKESFKCNIFSQDIDPTKMDESSLPNDIHLVEYEVNGRLYVDSVRAYKAADIFDPYYDKLKELGGKLVSITNGYGRIKPKLYNPSKEG